MTDYLEDVFNGGCPRCHCSTVLLTELDGKAAYKCSNCGYVLEAPVVK